MAACDFPGLAAMRSFTAILFAFLFLLAGVHYTEQSASSDAGTPPEAGAPPQAPVLEPTRESIYRHLAAELQHALGAEEHIKGVFAGLAAGIEDSVTHTVIPSLQALVDSVVERAEDAWIVADDAGRTVQVKECVDGAEYDAQQVAKRALEKMRNCVDALEQEGGRRVREAARLLVEIEGISKRFVTALETCVQEEEAKAAAQPDLGTGGSTGDVTASPGSAVPTDASASESDAPAVDAALPAGETAVVDINTASTCSKDSVQESIGDPSCGCSKCKKAKATAQTTKEEIQPEAMAENKRKCKKGEKCDKLKEYKKKEKLIETGTLKEESRKNKDDKFKKGSESVIDEHEVVIEEENETVQEEQATAERTQREGKNGKKIKYNENSQKMGRKSKKGSKHDSSIAEEPTTDKVSKKDKSLEKERSKKKVKKNEEQSQVSENNVSSDEETVEKTGKEENIVEGKNKKGKKTGKKNEKKVKGKKEKNNEGSMEGKGRRKRDLLAIQENPDETEQSAETPEQQTSAEQPESLISDTDVPPKWPTQGSTSEEKYVIACLQSPTMKPLMDEKTRAYQKLQGMLRRVQDKQQEAPATCVTNHVQKVELKINAIKTRMANCAERKMRSDL